MTSAAIIAALAVAVAAPAQAHEPYVAKAWGKNADGQLGNGTTGPEKCGKELEGCSTTPVEVSKLSGVIALAGGGRLGNGHSVALLEDGTVMSWGNNAEGDLGNGTNSSSTTPVPVCAPGETAPCASHLSEVTAIATAGSHSMALLKNGTVVEWGRTFIGGQKQSLVPVAVTGLGEVTAIAAGGNHGLAVLKNGRVMAWGANSEGDLGNGSMTASNVPVPVCAAGPQSPCPSGPFLEGVRAVSASNIHSVALLEGGTVMTWGGNGEGELGNGGEANSDVPVAVPGLSGVTAVAAGGFGSNGGHPFDLALLGNGKVMAWGANEEGQLGNGEQLGPEHCTAFMLPCSKKPIAVSLSAKVTTIAAHGAHSLALLEGGVVLAWGENTFGELGNGMSTGPEACLEGPCSTKPLEVGKLLDVKGIGAGDTHSLAFGPPPPSVTAISPNEARKKGTTSVTISGAEFEEATAVKFGTMDASSFTVNSEGSITAIAPPGTGTVDVTVTTPAGTSATSPADKFYYSRPSVKKLSPRKGPEVGGTSVTITGTNFAGVTAVKFGSSEATSFKVNSATSITATSPAHAAGKVDVTVSTPNGTSPISSKDRFKYT